MLYSQRNTGGYDSFKVMKDALNERVEARRKDARQQIIYDHYIRPFVITGGLIGIFFLARAAQKENEKWLENKCEEFVSFIGIPTRAPYEAAINLSE